MEKFDCWITIGFHDPNWYGKYLKKDLKRYRMKTSVSLMEAQDYCKWQGIFDSKDLIAKDPVFSKSLEESRKLAALSEYSESYYKEPDASIYFTTHIEKKLENEVENPELILNKNN